MSRVRWTMHNAGSPSGGARRDGDAAPHAGLGQRSRRMHGSGEPDGRLATPVHPPASLSESGVWSGISVSPGAATGAARIVHSPTDAAHLQQGDILVAPSTDPGWTPLFLRASAIVTETGGYLSHGAIV